MTYSRFGKTSALGLLASSALVSTAWAHTTSIGFENAGPGSVTFWYGSYHSSAFNEGSLNLNGPSLNVTVPFDLLATMKPMGLVDGTTNFYTDGGSPPMLVGTDPVISGGPEIWQGSTFTGLAPGAYTFTYVPDASPSSTWEPWDSAILSNMLTLSGQIIGGSAGNDSGIMATEAGAALTEAMAGDLIKVVNSNSDSRRAAAEGTSSMVMSQNGPSNSDFSVWARIGGGVVNADFGADLDISHFLAQVGVEAGLGENFAAGVSFGYGTTSSETAGADLDSDNIFVQPYVAFVDGGLTLVGAIGYTNVDYDDSTGVLDSGDRFTVSVEGAYAVPLSDSTAVGPVGFLAVGKEEMDVSAGDDDIEFVIAHAGIELSHTMELLNTGTLSVFASAGPEYITANAPEPAAALVDYDDDRFGGRVEAGFDFTIAGTSSQFFASVTGSGLFTDAPGASGNFGLKIPF